MISGGKALPGPVSVSPSAISIADTATGTVATASCTMLDASSCAGATFTLNDPHGWLTVSGSNINRTGTALVAGHYTDLQLQATKNGHTFPASPTNNLTLDVSAPGAAPAPAVAAGFTTPIIQADFTAGGTVKIFGGAPIANTNTNQYITNCGAAASIPNQPATWHFTYSATGNSGNTLPCPGNISIVSDTGVSPNTQALTRTLGVGQLASVDASLSFPVVYGQPCCNTSWLPNETFRIVTFRTDCGTLFQKDPSNCFFQPGTQNGEVAMWSTVADSAYTNHIDLNDIETNYAGGNQVWVGSMGYGAGGNIGPAFASAGPTAPPVYITAATLYTSDESSAIWACQWINPNASYTTGFTGCVSVSPTPSSIYTMRDRTYMFSTAMNPGANFDGVQSFPLNMWITKFEMWSCAGVASGSCPGPMISTWP
jgi:hypothetical protein